ncbi:MAG: hypothetical protein Q7K45_00505 [Nanoarchaeota archaeon]|nr:hypothetical protein [Nanoarchaeota archaeon]
MKYPHPLCGRIEAVYIRDVCGQSRSIGVIGEQDIKVNHAPTPAGESCLVRINMSCTPKEVYGNFITSHIPANFMSLGLEEYALVALWEERMLKQRQYPTFDEIGNYYRPGNLGRVYYFAADNSKRRRVIINKEGVVFNGKSYQSVVRKYTPHGAVCLLMTETASLLEDICGAFRERGLVPVVMEALK